MSTLLLLIGCTDPQSLTLAPDATSAPLVDDFVRFLDDPRVQVGDGPGVRVELYADQDCAECYTVSAHGGTWEVHGGAPLGVQYGLADVLERMGYGFFHPYETRRPEAFARPGTVEEESGAPVVARRGLHMHTLHPIEGLAAMWIPNETDEPARILDWVIKNRGNHVQWPALDDIQSDVSTQEAWEAHTRAIVDRAHGRGLTVGVGVQLFGASNLQQAWDLLDEVGTPEAQAAEMDERLATLAGVPWDVVNLSFGEFFGEDPQTFIDSTSLAYQRIQAAMPGVDVPAVIHVGNYDDLRVEYQGEEMLYYFLVTYADPGIRPWIHSVMYYNLYEDTGGAYLHDEFDEHRAFLEEALAAGDPVGYFPESAYWVAFDNPVPQYLPLYARSRSLDLERLVPQGLDDHVVFSTGWEWGYWQGDVASLQMSYRGTTWEDEVHRWFEPHLADAVVDLAEAQHAALIEARLTPWLAGRDVVIDTGDGLGILSQPDRPSYEEILAMDAEARGELRETVVGGLGRYADAVAAISVARTDGWAEEVDDGVAIDAARARFAAALVAATLDAAQGDEFDTELAAAEAALHDAGQIVTGRTFHDPAGERWLDLSWNNPTLYDYGYLRESGELCFWWRERAQVRNLLLSETNAVPPCIF